MGPWGGIHAVLILGECVNMVQAVKVVGLMQGWLECSIGCGGGGAECCASSGITNLMHCEIC